MSIVWPSQIGLDLVGKTPQKILQIIWSNLFHGKNELEILMTHRRWKQIDNHHTRQNQSDANDRVDV